MLSCEPRLAQLPTSIRGPAWPRKALLIWSIVAAALAEQLSGWARVEAFLATLVAAARDRLDMTSLLSQLIAGGARVRDVHAVGPWGEVDNATDLKLYEDMIREGALTLV